MRDWSGSTALTDIGYRAGIPGTRAEIQLPQGCRGMHREIERQRVADASHDLHFYESPGPLEGRHNGTNLDVSGIGLAQEEDAPGMLGDCGKGRRVVSCRERRDDAQPRDAGFVRCLHREACAMGDTGRDNPGRIESALHAALLEVSEDFPAGQVPVVPAPACAVPGLG